jgi:hypothetical protein
VADAPDGDGRAIRAAVVSSRAVGSGLAVGVARVTHLSLGLLSYPVGDLAGSRRVRLPDRLPMSQTVSGRIAQRLDFVGSISTVADLLKIGQHRHGRTMPACKLRQPPDCRCRLDDLRSIRAMITAMDAGCDDLLACARADSCPLRFGDIGRLPGIQQT